MLCLSKHCPCPAGLPAAAEEGQSFAKLRTIGVGGMGLRGDCAPQYFTRSVNFAFSGSPTEMLLSVCALGK